MLRSINVTETLFDSQGIVFSNKHSTQLGVCRKVAEMVSKITSDEFNTGKSLAQCIDLAATRETRKDCVRQFAHIYVDKYCHNDINLHRVDSNEKKVKVKKDPETGKPVFHPRRVWEGPVTIEQKYNDFLCSDEYKEFLQDHPTLKICRREDFSGQRVQVFERCQRTFMC